MEQSSGGFSNLFDPIGQALFNDNAFSPGGIPQAAAMMAGNVISKATGSNLAGGVAQGVVGALLS